MSRAGRAVAAALAAATLALGGCGWLGGVVDRLRGGGKEIVEPPSPLPELGPEARRVTELWRRDAGEGTGGLLLGIAPLVAGDTVYVADRKGRVHAFDAATGAPRWEADVKAPVSGGPGGGGGLILVGTPDAEVVALDAASGAVRWRSTVTSEILAAPRAGAEVVVVRSVDGRLAALDLADGRRRWVYARRVPPLSLRGTGAPVVDGDRVYAGFDDGRLAALRLADGRLLWERAVAVPRGRSELERMVDVDADPVVVDGVVYAVAYQGNAGAWDADDGRPYWRRKLSSWAGLAVDGGRVYVTDDRSRVWALARLTGASLWRQDALARRALTRPAVAGGHVVVGDFEGWLHWLDTDDGRIVARVRVDSSGIAAPLAVRDDVVYALARDGTLGAYRLAE